MQESLSPERLLGLWARGLRQIALQAAVNPQRVFDLAETLEPMLDELNCPERVFERLRSYTEQYPDGADYLWEALNAEFPGPLPSTSKDPG